MSAYRSFASAMRTRASSGRIGGYIRDIEPKDEVGRAREAARLNREHAKSMDAHEKMVTEINARRAK
jgi:hypothetical protein